jgi:hypothetical protein
MIVELLLLTLRFCGVVVQLPLEGLTEMAPGTGLERRSMLYEDTPLAGPAPPLL